MKPRAQSAVLFFIAALVARFLTCHTVTAIDHRVLWDDDDTPATITVAHPAAAHESVDSLMHFDMMSNGDERVELTAEDLEAVLSGSSLPASEGSPVSETPEAMSLLRVMRSNVLVLRQMKLQSAMEPAMEKRALGVVTDPLDPVIDNDVASLPAEHPGGILFGVAIGAQWLTFAMFLGVVMKFVSQPVEFFKDIRKRMAILRREMNEEFLKNPFDPKRNNQQFERHQLDPSENDGELERNGPGSDKSIPNHGLLVDRYNNEVKEIRFFDYYLNTIGRQSFIFIHHIMGVVAFYFILSACLHVMNDAWSPASTYLLGSLVTLGLSALATFSSFFVFKRYRTAAEAAEAARNDASDEGKEGLQMKADGTPCYGDEQPVSKMIGVYQNTAWYFAFHAVLLVLPVLLLALLPASRTLFITVNLILYAFILLRFGYSMLICYSALNHRHTSLEFFLALCDAIVFSVSCFDLPGTFSSLNGFFHQLYAHGFRGRLLLFFLIALSILFVLWFLCKSIIAYCCGRHRILDKDDKGVCLNPRLETHSDDEEPNQKAINQHPRGVRNGIGYNDEEDEGDDFVGDGGVNEGMQYAALPTMRRFGNHTSTRHRTPLRMAQRKQNRAF